MNREEKDLYNENDLFIYCDNKIITVKSSESSIPSDDPKAIDKLNKRLEKLQKEKIKVKNREHEYYELPYINTEIKNIEDRIEDIIQLAKLDFEDMIFPDWKIIYNKELDKIQIYFNKKPDNEILWILEYRGFRKKRNQKAWQRSFNTDTIYRAKNIAEEIQNRK